ncbi:MAG: hypothetical protein HYY06_29085 [Deltaproteobacteria bacterium]|nr:hypothetical protein [Deltaproteobacteria bacterium]
MIGPITPGATSPQGDVDPVVAPTGDPLQDVLLLQYETFRAQRLDERENQLALREKELDAIGDAFRHAVDAARARKNSALFNAAISAGSLALTSIAEDGGDDFGKAFAGRAPGLAEDLDRAFGFGAAAQDEELAEKAANNEADRLGKEEADASDRLDEFRRLQSRTIELLESIQSSKNKSEAAKLA